METNHDPGDASGYPRRDNQDDLLSRRRIGL
jgi:hypothetical protein